MNRTHENKAAGIAGVWHRVVRLFRHGHNPLLVASLTAFNEPRLYFPPDFNPPLRLVLSRL